MDRPGPRPADHPQLGEPVGLLGHGGVRGPGVRRDPVAVAEQAEHGRARVEPPPFQPEPGGFRGVVRGAAVEAVGRPGACQPYHVAGAGPAEGGGELGHRAGLVALDQHLAFPVAVDDGEHDPHMAPRSVPADSVRKWALFQA